MSDLTSAMPDSLTPNANIIIQTKTAQFAWSPRGVATVDHLLCGAAPGLERPQRPLDRPPRPTAAAERQTAVRLAQRAESDGAPTTGRAYQVGANALRGVRRVHGGCRDVGGWVLFIFGWLGAGWGDRSGQVLV